ncbi:MAG TPA: sialidase family protein, partial [Niastella sp.]
MTKANTPIRALFFFLLLFLTQTGYTQTFGTPIPALNPFPGTGGSIGSYTKMMVVNGNPAMCFYDNNRTSLYYVRALDANGITWGSGVTLDITGVVGTCLSLQIVNGNPAVTYFDASGNTLRFVRATDANGSTWGAPQSIDATGNVGQYTTSLQVVNGNPAITYYDVANEDLRFVRATDANGTTWEAPQTIDATGSVGQDASLYVVNGNPAIVYFDSDNIRMKFVRATDANGTAWGAPQTVTGDDVYSQPAILQIVNGAPAIAYYDTYNVLKFIRATDIDGIVWGTPQALSAVSDGGVASLQIVNGFPAIAYNVPWAGRLNYIRATDASGSAWGPEQTLDAGNVGWPNSLQVVNGFPAIAYYSSSDENVKFVRAADANGITWNAPQSFDAKGSEGLHNSLEIVSGNPAFSYYDATNFDLKFVRATNRAGTAWGTPQTLDGATANVGRYSSLKMVNNHPAVAYYNSTSRDLQFVRATNSDGTAWGTPQTLDGATGDNVGTYTALQVVNGNPAIAYYDGSNSRLKYVRATDADGTGWGAPLTLNEPVGSTGTNVSFQIVNGNPAISYYDPTNGGLKFIRALDANGTTWGAAITLDGAGTNVGAYTSLQIIDGYPAIAYVDVANQDLKFVRATDASGTGWGIPLTIDANGNVGQYASLQMVNGNPAIAYLDASANDLKFVRATDAGGITWAAPMTLHSTENIGYYVSMISNGAGAGIVYYSLTEQLPYFIATTEFLALPVTLTHIAAQWK